MARRIFLGRRNWVREPGVVITGTSGAIVSVSLDNLKTIRPQEVCEFLPEPNASWRVDLGAQRRIGAISYHNLRAASGDTIRTLVTTDGSTPVYDTGTVTAWPKDATPGGLNPWGVTTPEGVYNAEFMEALGFPRVFMPSATVVGRYIDTTVTFSTNPLQIGVMGVWEPWEPPQNFTYGWSIDVLDESDVVDLPYGSTYVTERGVRRRLNFGFPAMPRDEFLRRQLDYTLVMGKRRPVLAVPFPDDGATGDLEKTAVYGLIANDSQLANPFFQRFVQTFQIKQLI